MSFAEKGVVSDIEPAFFIGYLHRQKATGTLKFEDSPVHRAIYFRDGRVLFSSSNAPEDQLGAILVSSGKIGQEQFDAIVTGLQPKQSIAAALAQGGLVSQKDIGDAARHKVEQIVGSCCAQIAGRYEFEDGVLPKGALDLKLTTEKVLTSAFEGLEPSGFLSRILKSPMAVLVADEIEPADPDLLRLRGALDGFSALSDIGGMVGLTLPQTEIRAAVLVVLGAASVVTSQIEEMTLPDTGETLAGVPVMELSDESESSEGETLSLVEPDAPNPGAMFGAGDSTLVMGPSLDEPYSTSPEATLMMGPDLGLASPSALENKAGPVGSGLTREKATTSDLAAIKELIGSPPVPRSESPAPSSQAWVPKLSTAGRPVRGRGGIGEALKDPKVKLAAGIGLLVGLGGLTWVGYQLVQDSRAPQATTALAPPQPQPKSSPAPTAFQGSAASAALPVPPPAATGSPSGVMPSPAPSSTPPAPAAVPTPKSVETPIPTITPKPPAPPAPTPVPAPVPATKPAPAAGPTMASGYEALKALRFPEAATVFETVARTRGSEFSVQLLVACSPETVTKAVQNDPSTDLFILPTTFSGKACYRVMRGFFKTNGEASQAVASLPNYYTVEGAKPRAVSVKSVLR